ncbi:Trk system potassium transporter TrkA [Halosquirtibacter xylanolyticus]|uniref:Trk system potassium transporter TrkA n=1 Tax=Halosquirtibacter xylanolyticus TaxID=3374599 RepID=UPI00374920B1|nr:Trk system potassium transporter TrkA [Prolixibacteraceae bacterium]
MNIVIAGAGEVGSHLAKMLTFENHDIVVLDEDEEKLSMLASSLDLMTVEGSAISIRDLRESGAAQADLFIAVTPYEERNLIACQLAKDLGSKKTIARIDNQEYLFKHNQEKFDRMGIDELIYPEHLAAKEIVEYIKLTNTRQVLEFSSGQLILFGIKIRERGEFVGQTLAEMSETLSDFRVVAISRYGETIIPTGSDQILLNDLVFFISKKDKVDEILKRAGKHKYNIKNIMILGGSRIGVKTALRLKDQFKVTIIEADKKRSHKIASKLDDAMVINGDGRDLDLLKDEGIDKVDAFVAVTGNAETNILSCQMAKKMGVKRTVAEVENMDYLDFAENIGIGGVINKKRIAASYIYRFTMNTEVTHVKCLTASDAEVFEFVAKPHARITKNPLKDIHFPDGVSVGGVIRANEGIIANGATQVQVDDRVIIFCLPHAIHKLSKLFK